MLDIVAPDAKAPIGYNNTRPEISISYWPSSLISVIDNNVIRITYQLVSYRLSVMMTTKAFSFINIVGEPGNNSQLV